MGHYASEMSPTWGQGRKEIEKWQKAGFTPVNNYALESRGLECKVCAALVLDWKKHRKVCKKNGN